MRREMEACLTYSLLDSWRVTARAANFAALVASAGVLLPGPSLSRWIFVASLLCWMVGSWLAMRVSIDASLFRVFAEGDSQAVGTALDELLIRLGFPSSQCERSVTDRSRGAVHLWRCHIAACAAQLGVLIAALTLTLWSA
jgi:hypothetical protein